MASVEHCLYCFETLASRLEKRRGFSLPEVQKLCREYAKTPASEGSIGSSFNKKQLPAFRRLANPSSDTGSASSGSSMSLATETSATSLESLPDAADITDNDEAEGEGGEEEEVEEEEEKEDDELITESPLFVTWNTVSRRSAHRSLRGCIGTFEAQKLDLGLAEYALTSAIHDTRFPPVERNELPELEVAVTLLTDFEECDDAMDWTLGVHGLRISFTYHGRRYGATYLPDVAVEQEWTKEETLVSLMRKAGWMGRRDRWRDVELKVVRYQGKKVSIEYAEYLKWYEWARKNGKTKDGKAS
ncbi:hypothetical protein SODALDRAFT_326904 [Sodiomyces alkalinus F11]|uniref:AMMECR1 domain-containing protein n=1 Tax=Sodiomyces alkalinus (strain CBS 110278 / VKM F-3762 / F11) TaxID=1314773 RepID=A0A3N2Q7U0_SODAK|nr:hypothetical protein SODALDRAFT_326904 [Sodiomyces alkalinus F11]ROT42747.1 hypothetical protein SODALDRAFT_326904 [Sodiomyces alkalinus F11]